MRIICACFHLSCTSARMNYNCCYKLNLIFFSFLISSVVLLSFLSYVLIFYFEAVAFIFIYTHIKWNQSFDRFNSEPETQVIIKTQKIMTNPRNTVLPSISLDRNGSNGSVSLVGLNLFGIANCILD